jgi:Protein of unknown function, DUF481
MEQLRKSIVNIVVTFLCVLCLKANAQLNRIDTLDWQIKLSASGSLLDGNVSRFILVNRLEVAYARPVWGMNSRNDYQYGTARHNKTENDFVSYNFFYASPLKKLYPYLMEIVETNYRRKIRVRDQFGPGISYTVSANENNLVRLSITGTYEHTRFGGTKFENVSDTLSNIISVWRITGRLFGRQQVFENKLRLSYEFWWQQSVTDYHNYRFYNEEILEVPLNKKLSFRTNFRYTYENVRLKGLKPYDLFWTFGLALSNF